MITPEEIEIIRESASNLTRLESGIATNAFAAEAILTSVHDLVCKAPEERRNKLMPLVDKLLSIAEDLSIVNQLIQDKLFEVLGEDRYGKLVVETIRILDTASGKITACETCLAALDHKKKIKQELNK